MDSMNILCIFERKKNTLQTYFIIFLFAIREEERDINRSISNQFEILSQLSAVLESSPDLSQEELEELLSNTPGINVLGNSMDR